MWFPFFHLKLLSLASTASFTHLTKFKATSDFAEIKHPNKQSCHGTQFFHTHSSFFHDVFSSLVTVHSENLCCSRWYAKTLHLCLSKKSPPPPTHVSGSSYSTVENIFWFMKCLFFASLSLSYVPWKWQWRKTRQLWRLLISGVRVWCLSALLFSSSSSSVKFLAKLYTWIPWNVDFRVDFFCHSKLTRQNKFWSFTGAFHIVFRRPFLRKSYFASP